MDLWRPTAGIIKKLFKTKHQELLRRKFERITPSPPEPPSREVTYRVRGFSREFITEILWIQWISYLQTAIHFRMGKNGVERYYKDTGEPAEQKRWEDYNR